MRVPCSKPVSRQFALQVYALHAKTNSLLPRHVDHWWPLLPLKEVAAILAYLDVCIPFFDRSEWAQWLPALAAVYCQDMDRIVPGLNRKVYQVLHSAAAARAGTLTTCVPGI